MSVFSLESDKKKIRSESDLNIIGCVPGMLLFSLVNEVSPEVLINDMYFKETVRSLN